VSIYHIIYIIYKNLKYFILLPLVMAFLMFFLTRNEKFIYTSKGTIFTAITSNQSITDMENGRVDFFATKTAYSNLLTIITSKKIKQETALRLLAQHLVQQKPDIRIMSEENFWLMKATLPAELLKLADTTSEEKTYQNLLDYLQESEHNQLYNLIHNSHPFYGENAISNVKTIQAGGSDIIEITYESTDPGITYNTLKILIDVFLKEYILLKKNQTNAVVEYFERQLKNASIQLKEAEYRILLFNTDNNIINFYEQTKHISSQQEKIEVIHQEMLMEFNASEAVLIKLEEESKVQYRINLKNKEILNTRNSLVKINTRIAEYEINQASDSFQLKDLYLDKKRMEGVLSNKIDSLYIYEKNTEGVAIEKLLEDWLRTVIEYESGKAKVIAIEKKVNEFKKIYSQYAPYQLNLSGLYILHCRV